MTSYCKYETNENCVLLKKGCVVGQKGCVITASGYKITVKPEDKNLKFTKKIRKAKSIDL